MNSVEEIAARFEAVEDAIKEHIAKEAERLFKCDYVRFEYFPTSKTIYLIVGHNTQTKWKKNDGTPLTITSMEEKVVAHGQNWTQIWWALLRTSPKAQIVHGAYMRNGTLPWQALTRVLEKDGGT